MVGKNKKYLVTAGSAGLLLLIIDFVTKNIANNVLIFQKRTDSFISGLSFYLTHNTGYHYIFGEIKNHTLWSIFGLLMLMVLLYSIAQSLRKETDLFFKRLYAVILALTIGAGGNVIEILVTKKATDFFVLHPFPWPSNICDQYINAIIYIILPIMIIKLIVQKVKTRKEVLKENRGSE
jgi:lipoprotein signal peptidase